MDTQDSATLATHVRLSLTERNLRAAQPGDILRDDEVPGLYAKVGPKGATFHLYYRTKARAERRPKLGKHGGISIVQARNAARAILERVAKGEDPGQEALDQKRERTMADLWAEWRTRKGGAKKTAQEDERKWVVYCQPLHRLKLSDVSFAAIDDLHTAMADTPYQANRVLSMLKTVCEYAIAPLQWAPAAWNGVNPCRGVEPYREQARRRYVKSGEASRISAQLQVEEAANPASVAFLRLLILTGARCGEIAKATWRDIEDGAIVLREHKADGTGDERRIFLSPDAVKVLEGLPRTAFGTITGVQSPKKLWDKIRVAAKCPDLRLHDLRHTFAAECISLGFGLDQIGELLGHHSAQTTKRYAHLQDEAAKAAVEKVGASLQGRMA